MGLFMRMRESRGFSDEEANLMLGRMAELRKGIVDINTAGEYDWRTPPERGTGAIILPITDVAHAMYEEHRGFLQVRAPSIEEIPIAKRATCGSDEEFVTQLNTFWKSRNRSGSFFHNQIHINLRDFAAEVRKQVLDRDGQVQSASKLMSDPESHDWKGYIVDDVTHADKPTSLYSMGAVIRKGINGLKDRHVSLTKFRTHVEGMDHATAKQSRRSTKNHEATTACEETLQPIRQHDKTISDAIQRRADIEKLLAVSSSDLEKALDAVNDPSNPMDHDAKRAEIDRLRNAELRYHTDNNRLLTDIGR